MSFEEFIKEIKNGRTVEEIAKSMDFTNVECDGNHVYEDDDFLEFLTALNANIKGMNNGYIVICTKNNNTYQIPYMRMPNRFNTDLPYETILRFDLIA